LILQQLRLLQVGTQLRHLELERHVIRKDLELDTQRDPLVTPFIINTKFCACE
jgi:hypothetical protein